MIANKHTRPNYSTKTLTQIQLQFSFRYRLVVYKFTSTIVERITSHQAPYLLLPTEETAGRRKLWRTSEVYHSSSLSSISG